MENEMTTCSRIISFYLAAPIISLICFGFAASSSASVLPAVPTVTFEFTGTTGSGIVGSNEIYAESGDVLTMNLMLQAPDDGDGINSYGVSVKFDDDLDIILAPGPQESLPSDFVFNLTSGVAGTQESTLAQMGFIYTFEAATFGVGPVGGDPFVIGTFQFLVTSNVADDGPDIFSGFFNDTIDGICKNSGPCWNEGPVEFGTATVVPEPSTALLMGLGLIGLARVSRRREP
jgi:hypothetical protein